MIGGTSIERTQPAVTSIRTSRVTTRATGSYRAPPGANESSGSLTTSQPGASAAAAGRTADGAITSEVSAVPSDGVPVPPRTTERAADPASPKNDPLRMLSGLVSAWVTTSQSAGPGGNRSTVLAPAANGVRCMGTARSAGGQVNSTASCGPRLTTVTDSWGGPAPVGPAGATSVTVSCRRAIQEPQTESVAAASPAASPAAGIRPAFSRPPLRVRAWRPTDEGSGSV